MSTPVMSLNNSPANRGELPLPADAMLVYPDGLALAYAMNSGTVLAETRDGPSMTRCVRAIPATGAMSRIRS